MKWKLGFDRFVCRETSVFFPLWIYIYFFNKICLCQRIQQILKKEKLYHNTIFTKAYLLKKYNFHASDASKNKPSVWISDLK